MAKFIVEGPRPDWRSGVDPSAVRSRRCSPPPATSSCWGSRLDDVDLYRPIIDMYVSVIKSAVTDGMTRRFVVAGGGTVAEIDAADLPGPDQTPLRAHFDSKSWHSTRAWPR